jgi:hypothetical protein
MNGVQSWGRLNGGWRGRAAQIGLRRFLDSEYPAQLSAPKIQ